MIVVSRIVGDGSMKLHSDMLRTQVHNIFLEDMAIIRAQQQNMDLGPSPVQNLAQDKAWVAMRQIVQRLVQEEQQHAVAA